MICSFTVILTLFSYSVATIANILYIRRYRRIAGDQCTIDETAENNYFLPEKIPCPILGMATRYTVVQ